MPDIFNDPEGFLEDFPSHEKVKKDKCLKEWDNKILKEGYISVLSPNVVFIYCKYINTRELITTPKKNKLKNFLLKEIPSIPPLDEKFEKTFYPVQRFKLDNPIEVSGKWFGGERGYGVRYNYLGSHRTVGRQMGRLRWFINQHKKENDIVTECKIYWGENQASIVDEGGEDIL